ncbi:MAG: tRNA adenosine(34) deaminase TadA [Gammaproteobacteria bacterium]|nr:tRNA adenosine(34) deaminase TadA [Gammaproteobacteria bacterium]
MNDERWMRRAIELAAHARDAGEVPVGALLVRGDEVLGEGFNQPISSVDPTAHAEIVALRVAAAQAHNYRLPGSTLYVTVEPCAMCAGALIHARVAHLVYGAAEPRSGAVTSVMQVLDPGKLNHEVAVTCGVMAEECAELLRAFFKAKRGPV